MEDLERIVAHVPLMAGSPECHDFLRSLGLGEVADADLAAMRARREGIATDPFVTAFNRLAAKYGRQPDGSVRVPGARRVWSENKYLRAVKEKGAAATEDDG